MSDFDRGWMVCGCERFAFIMKASVLKDLPKDYHGEVCSDCNLFMCAVDKLPKEEEP